MADMQGTRHGKGYVPALQGFPLTPARTHYVFESSWLTRACSSSTDYRGRDRRYQELGQKLDRCLERGRIVSYL